MKLTRTVRWAGHLSLVVLILAHATFIAFPGNLSVLSAGLVDALYFSQTSLLLLVLVLGPGRWYARIPLAGVGLTLVIWKASSQWADWIEPQESLQMFAFVATGTIAGLAAWRIMGRRVERAKLPMRAEGAQFSLRSMLLLTVSVALLIGVAQAVRGLYEDQLIMPHWIYLLIGALSMSAVSLAAARSLLGSGGTVSGVILLAIVAPGMSLFTTYATRQMGDWLSIMGWFAAHSILTGFSLLVLRSAGYRLGARRQPITDSSASKVDAAVALSPQEAACPIA